MRIHLGRSALLALSLSVSSLVTGCAADTSEAPVTDDQLNAKDAYERAKAVASAYLEARRTRSPERTALDRGAGLVGQAAADFAALGKPCSASGYPRSPSALKWKPDAQLRSLPEGVAYVVEVYAGGATQSLDFIVVYDAKGRLIANIRNIYSVADTTTTLTVCP